MLTLAIETSDRCFSAALLENGDLIAEVSSSDHRSSEYLHKTISESKPEVLSSDDLTASTISTGSSESIRYKPLSVGVGLFPLLKKLFDDTNHKFEQIELLGVTYGPGRFTGLRSGIVAAKSLAYASQIPVVAVNTLEVIACQSLPFLQEHTTKEHRPTGSTVRVLPVINAQRQQLFSGIYEVNLAAFSENFKEIRFKKASPNRIENHDQWLDGLLDGDWVTGAGLKPILDQVPQYQVGVVSQTLWLPTAETVGKLAWQYFQAGQRDDIWTLEPFYFRPSYAEE